MSEDTITLSREQIQAAFMQMSVAEIHEIYAHVGESDRGQCIFIECDDPRTGYAGVTLSSGRTIWTYTIADETPGDRTTLVYWRGEDSLSVRR